MNSRATARRALVPGSLMDDRGLGPVRGVFHASSGVLNLFAPGTPQWEDAPEVGAVYASAEELPAWAREATRTAFAAPLSKRELLDLVRGAANDPGRGEKCSAPATAEPAPAPADGEPAFCLFWGSSADDADELRCVGPGGAYAVERYDLHRELFSRNTGILETDLMARKRAIILGCGSVGSLVALELARAGVGHFLLVDTDILEYHNLCRHQCGIRDVGRYKVDALHDRILDINPRCDVRAERGSAEGLPKEAFDEWAIPGESLIVGCADNREADVYANGVAVLYGVPFLSIGFWERAFAGELFFWLPGRDQPCYRCALGSGNAISQRVNANHHIYTNQADLAAVSFEPGISVDISFVTTVGIKLALDILNEGNPAFTQRLLPSLRQYTLVCNTNDPAVGGPLAEIFSYPLQVTTSLKVGFGPSCPPCAYAREDPR